MSEIKNIAEILRLRRLELRLNQSKLAEKAGTYRNSIWKIENNRKDPPLSMFIRICKALDLDAWEVLKQATKKSR